MNFSTTLLQAPAEDTYRRLVLGAASRIPAALFGNAGALEAGRQPRAVGGDLCAQPQ